jgi:hypothetical protein
MLNYVWTKRQLHLAPILDQDLRMVLRTPTNHLVIRFQTLRNVFSFFLTPYSFCEMIVSFCGMIVSFCGMIVSFCGTIVSFCGMIVSFCGMIVSFFLILWDDQPFLDVQLFFYRNWMTFFYYSKENFYQGKEKGKEGKEL